MIEWKDIEGYEGQYQVSNTGLVKSLARERIGCGGSIVEVKEKVLKLQRNNYTGYLTINLYKNGKNSTKSIHRLVGQTFIPNPDNLPVINHKDGDKFNNNDWNLEWCTSSYNNIHAYATGLREKTITYSKITEKEVIEIRKLKGKKTVKELMLIYNIGSTSIYSIINNRSWKNVEYGL